MNTRICVALSLLLTCFTGAAEPPLTVSIAQKEEGSKLIEIRFTNTSDDLVTIFRPLDGSLWLWHLPHYDFTVTNSEGIELKRAGRCGVSGLWADTEWPKDYLLPIPAKQTESVTVYLPHRISDDGEYEISFRYKWTAPGELPATFKSVFEGEIESAAIRASIKKRL